jgi:hypothetical protein
MKMNCKCLRWNPKILRSQVNTLIFKLQNWINVFLRLKWTFLNFAFEEKNAKLDPERKKLSWASIFINFVNLHIFFYSLSHTQTHTLTHTHTHTHSYTQNTHSHTQSSLSSLAKTKAKQNWCRFLIRCHQ